MATDLNTDFLSVAKEVGIVNDCAAENAEQLTFGDSSFDYVLCKESYHHFPRPYSGLYEMIRVSRKGIVLIEPNDPVIQMPLLLLLTNLTKRWPWLQQKIWHNRFSYEPVGNFVYKVSKREFEKFAAGLQLPAVAFKCFNPNFYKKQYEYKPSSLLKLSFLLLRIKKLMLDVLMKLNILPGQVLSAIIFKELPDIHQQEQLKAEGYSIVLIPKSPY